MIFKRDLICPYCYKKITDDQLGEDNACPECKKRLPAGVSNNRNLFFSVVGTEKSGKTSYIAALLETLKKSIKATGVHIREADDETINVYRRDFFGALHDKNKSIKPTIPGKSQPLVYCFSGTKEMRGKLKITKTAIISIYDASGENFKKTDSMEIYNQSIYHSHGILMMLDPKQLRIAEKPFQEENELLIRISNLIRNELGLAPKKLITIPLAVVLTKSDVLKGGLKPGTPLFQDTIFDKRYDESDFLNLNHYVQSLLKSWEGSEPFLQQIEGNFSEYGFFALSVFDKNSDDNQSSVDISPKRVLDPFLWLAKKNKLIKVKRRF